MLPLVLPACVWSIPDPVKLIPMMSRPASAAGMPWIWMGVGRLMPFSARTLQAGGRVGRQAACMLFKFLLSNADNLLLHPTNIHDCKASTLQQ